ncbi:BglII/BstYI family type II restriction endonuclease [Ekhidna sp.]|uniref:BglII/BstYI family type II restriction endonuclease n=1 Tax=Ekhidna sp. TaxID=2608089 RepID=UPI003514BF5A
MANFYENRVVIEVKGYEIYFTRFSDSILSDHFKEATDDLKYVLDGFHISENQIVEGGGGLSSITQNLRDRLYEKGWNKINIKSEQRVRDRVLSSESHEIDHYKEFEKGNIGLEIEWNNKDPFFDRDLENFRKLHQLGELTLGIIITRGETLQKELLNVFHRFLISLRPEKIEEISEHISLSVKDQAIIKNMLTDTDVNTYMAIARKIYTSKFGSTTTHMDKLHLRINRGVGNPCPLIMIGIGKDRLT